MKNAVAKEHREFYKKNGWIEFENIFTKEQVELFNRLIDQALCEKLKIPEDKIVSITSENGFQHGRDLWRAHESLCKLVCLPRVGEIVSELIELKPLRLGFDQYLPPIAVNNISRNPLYSKFLKNEQSLENMSCIKGLVAGLILCLTPPKEKIEAEKAAGLFPEDAGNVIIFNPLVPFNFADLTAHANQRYYLVGYAQNSSYYYLQPNDPHTHHLKKYGYIYNDKLSDKFNPIVYR
jgi:hypothetical protein